MATPTAGAGRGRLRVLSRQYEASVRDQCWTAEITAMRNMEGRWGLREAEITGDLMPCQQAE